MKNRNLRKRWVALVAAATVAIAMLPGMAQTAKAAGERGTFTLNGVVQSGTLIDSGYADSGQKFTYKIIERSDGTRHLEFAGSGDMPNYNDSELDNRWKKVENITTVAFCKGITRIGNDAMNVSGLEEIWLPEGLLEIGDGAFFDFKGTYIRIPSTVTSIEEAALYSYDGTYLTYPASLSYIENGNWITHAKNKYYPGTEEEFLNNVKGYGTGSLYNDILESNGFNSKDRNYDNYSEYVPFSVSANPTPDNSFVDVNQGDYFYDAVNWAKDENITSGEDATHFGTGHPLNRAAAVTFIYAYDGGGNTSTSSGFSDVQSSDWFAKQVTWAVQKGVTKGVGGNRFDPYGTVTRAQAVQFLYNYTGGSVGTRTAFSDVSSANWFYNAVSWAVENNITSGTGNGQFSPNAPCLREQFVMFLYKLSQTK